MAEILPIRCKTLFNQLIFNYYSFYQTIALKTQSAKLIAKSPLFNTGHVFTVVCGALFDPLNIPILKAALLTFSVGLR